MTPGEREQLRAELKAERRRVRALEAELSTLRGGLASVKADLERISESRSWRWGHAVATALARARPGRVQTQGAVVAALDRIARLEESLGIAPASAASGLLALPPGHAERVPQAADPAPLAAEVRRRLGDPPPPAADPPLVSAVVVTRDGLTHVQRLVAGLRDHTDYLQLELVVVDNASSDGTAEWLGSADAPFPVTVERNPANHPFAQANNEGAALARGELLLFLNNDIEPFEAGWLRELVAALAPGVAAVGARLLHGAVTHPDAPSGWILQHRGIRFRADELGLRGRNLGDGDDAFAEGFGTQAGYPAATAACLLVRREAFDAVGGFALGYRWGTEDVDLGLQLVEAGHEVRCTGRAVILHRESSTQTAEGREFMRLNRLVNRALFDQRWAARVRREVRLDRLAGGRFWSEDPPSVAITVTSNDPRDGWGDWYTAHELGDALEDRGWRVHYAERRGERWYDLPADLDYALVLIDAFDARRLDPSVVAVAWIRNWTERWLDHPWLDRLDLLLCSSQASVDVVREATGRPAELFPLATNPKRFRAPEDGAERPLDYVFAGNRWDEPRAVERALDPRPGERVAIYGRGWDVVDELAGHWRGSATYEELPGIYGDAKVVVDDAARHTQPYGAVNSRVFDALACGTPVVTNGADGVHRLFDAEFPVWDSPETLRRQLDALLSDPARRAAVAERYRARVLREHTYARRAERLGELLQDFEQRVSFVFKIGAPSWEVAPRWGDLHFAVALGRELRRRGHRSLVQVLPEWEDAAGHAYDVAVVLRGLSRHAPKPGQFNVLWNISHPDELTGEECDGYDLVCVASESFAAQVRGRTRTPVIVLEQATDPRLFRPEPRPEYAHELVFVGNSRNVRRRIIGDLLPTEHELAVYGGGWEPFLDARHVVADHVPNEQVHHVYSSAAIVLNDHWEDMRAHGFISNRIYDAVACGALVISDHVDGLEERFGGAVVTYGDRDELHQLVERFLADRAERAARGAAGRELVLAHHTFAHRVDALLAAVHQRMAATGPPTRIAAAAR